jgi:hypothetical protein
MGNSGGNASHGGNAMVSRPLSCVKIVKVGSLARVALDIKRRASAPQAAAFL